MSALSIQPTYPIFTDIDGQPLEAGYIFIGTANLNPITNPINVYWDAALTQPAAQPIRTVSGYPSNAGTPARLYVGSDYSIQIQNKNGTLVYSAPTATERYAFVINADGVNFTGFKGQVGFVSDLADDDGSDWVGFEQAGANAVARSAQDKMRDLVSVKDFGAVGDNTADDTDAFEAAIATGQGIYIPAGTYRLTRTLDTRTLGLGNGKAIVGAGRQSSILNFSGIDGLFLDNEGTFFSSVGIFNSVFINAFTGNPATDRLNIAAGITGIKIGRSHMTIQDVYVRGFARGVDHFSRYYTTFQGSRFLENLVGLYNDNAAGGNAAQFNSFYSCEFNRNYESNIFLTRGSGWDFYSCSFETCIDENADNANYPNGGVYVAAAARANFQNCWIESANVFLDGACNVSTNQWRKTWLGSPCNIDNYFTERKTINLVEPIYTAAPAWPDTISDVVISKSNANLNDGKWYTSITDSRGAGVGKDYISAFNEGIRGLFYAPNTFGGWIHAGIWLQLKTANLGNFFLDIEVEDTNGTVYSIDGQSRLQPSGKPDLTLVNQWQYVGFFAPIRESFKTAFPLRRVRMRLRGGATAADYSGSPREYWLAEPTLRMFVTEGQPLVNSI